MGTRQLIALIVDKMVLKCIPPKMGLGIVKALQQPVLNMFKEMMSDQLTKFLQPPGGMGGFVETRTKIHRLDPHNTVDSTIDLLHVLNPPCSCSCTTTTRTMD